jgi:hypothetical protein
MEQKHLCHGTLIGTILGPVAVAVSFPAHGQAPAQAEPDGGSPHSIEAYVSDDALQAKYQREMQIDTVGRTEVSGGLFFNEQRDVIAVGSALSTIGNPDSEPLRRVSLRVGPSVYGAFLNGEDQDIFGVGLGGEARYYLGTERNTAISLAAYYAPDILTFGNADSVKDAEVRVETRLRPGTMIFFGYRRFEFELPVDRDVDDSFHIGFRRNFR